MLKGIRDCALIRAHDCPPHLRPDYLLLSRVIYDNNANTIVAGVTQLPPGCVGMACVAATASGSYPTAWNNALIDGSFGITSKIVLDQITRDGDFISSIEVPNSSQGGVGPGRDQIASIGAG